MKEQKKNSTETPPKEKEIIVETPEVAEVDTEAAEAVHKITMR